MDRKTPKEDILAEYKDQAYKILSRMYNVLMRAHRKVDDVEYREVLEKLHKL